MKKILLLGAIGLISLATTSCASVHTSPCIDAYRQADYTSYKAKKDIKFNINLKLKKCKTL